MGEMTCSRSLQPSGVRKARLLLEGTEALSPLSASAPQRLSVNVPNYSEEKHAANGRSWPKAARQLTN